MTQTPHRRTFDSWQHYRDAVYEDLCLDGSSSGGKYAFRGVSNESHEPLSSLDRLFAHLSEADRAEVAEEAGDRFRELAARHGVDRGTDLKHLLALGQHWGLPTRLIDWTLSPYIAAYFAFSTYARRPLTDRNVDDSVAIWRLDIRHSLFRRRDDVAGNVVEVAFAHPEFNSRLHAQDGLFTINRTGRPFINVLRDSGALEALSKAVLPASEAKAALSDLKLMGIHDASMFPDLAGAALSVTAELMWKWEVSARHGPRT